MSTKPKQVMMSYREVATAMLKAQDIHEGLWEFTVTFGATGALKLQTDPGGLMPAAVVPVVRVGLVQVQTLHPLAVDAAVVNPKSRIVLPGFGPGVN